MTKLNRLLAATDLSAPARHAVDRGFLVAATTGAAYSVMHALEVDALAVLNEWIGDESGNVKQRLEAYASQLLWRQLNDPAHNRGVAANGVIVAGSPLPAIIDQADAVDADLLVVGMHGDDFLRHLLLGSTVSRLLRKSSRRPILVVKQPPHEPYRRLLIPVDFSPASASAIQLGRLIAPRAEIVLLHAFEVPFESKLAYAGVEDDVIQHYRRATRENAMRRLFGLAEAVDLSAGDYTPLVVHGDPFQQVAAQEQELDCDLIVMGKHGLSITEELLLGSVTQQVLGQSQSDVLVVTDTRRPDVEKVTP